MFLQFSGESKNIEYKVSLFDKSEKYMKTIVAFANIFSQMGLVEAWGSGIKRIFNAADEYGLPKPRFQEFDNMFRVELFRVNPITDQANQATNQVNQDFERLDFFSCLYSRFTCKFREISRSGSGRYTDCTEAITVL